MLWPISSHLGETVENIKRDYTKSDRVIATGKRKSCNVVVTLKPGKGIVKINRTDF